MTDRNVNKKPQETENKLIFLLNLGRRIKMWIKIKNLGRRLPAPGTLSPSLYSLWCTGSSGSGRVFSFLNHDCVIFHLEQVVDYNDDIGWKQFFYNILLLIFNDSHLCEGAPCAFDRHLALIETLVTILMLLLPYYSSVTNIRKWSMCSQLKNKIVKIPGCQLLPRYWSPPQAHSRLWRTSCSWECQWVMRVMMTVLNQHSHQQCWRQRQWWRECWRSDDEKVTNLSSLTLQVTGPVVRQVIPSLCSISQWNGCWNIFNRCYPSSQCSGQRHN